MTQPLTPRQLAAALNVSEWVVSDWARRGMVPFSQIGKRRWFDLAEVLAATKQPARRQRSLAVVRGDDFASAREFARGGAVQPRTKRGARSTAN